VPFHGAHWWQVHFSAACSVPFKLALKREQEKVSPDGTELALEDCPRPEACSPSLCFWSLSFSFSVSDCLCLLFLCFSVSHCLSLHAPQSHSASPNLTLPPPHILREGTAAGDNLLAFTGPSHPMQPRLALSAPGAHGSDIAGTCWSHWPWGPILRPVSVGFSAPHKAVTLSIGKHCLPPPLPSRAGFLVLAPR
jgi:hypothetical protein